jgi:transcriptional regulator with XRE-family HTH domain
MIRLAQLELFVKSKLKKAGETMRINRKKLIIAMLDNDQTVIQLAKASGVSRVTISNVKCGKSCSNATAEKIAKALNVPVSDIIENATAMADNAQ